MTATRSQILHEARTWLGTPFHHQARTKGVGVDCAGLVIGVGQALGFSIEDHPRRNYSRFPVVGRSLINYVEKNGIQVPIDQAAVGTVLVFWIHKRTRPQHMAIVAPHGKIIHAWYEAGEVVETHLGPYWDERTHAAYDYEGVM